MPRVYLIIYIRAREKEKYELKKGGFSSMWRIFFPNEKENLAKKGRNYKSIKESFRIKWKKSKTRHKK